MDIVRISESNYGSYDNMIYWRVNGTERKPEDLCLVSKEIQAELKNDNVYIYSAILDGKMVGWITLVYIPKVGKFNGRGHIYVDELWVQPSYRGRGISKGLMRKADDLRDRLGATGIRLYVSIDNTAAKACYESCGLEYSGKAYFMEK